MLQPPSIGKIATLIHYTEDIQHGVENWDAVVAELAKRKADSPASLIGAAATIAVESAHTFCPVSEYGDIAYFHKMYGSRRDYVTDAQGLWKWRGRGLIQLSGDANYYCAAHDLKLDLVNSPNLACSMPAAAEIFAWYWTRERLPFLCESAENAHSLWTEVRRKVNGGLNGLEDFLAAIDLLL